MSKRRNWTAQEKAFVRLISGRARQQDIADALGRAKGCVEQLQYRLGLGQGYHGGPKRNLMKLGPKATAEAWRRFQAGEHIDFDNLVSYVDKSASGRKSHWRQWQVDILDDLIGTCSMADIGKQIGKTAHAVRGYLITYGRQGEQVKYCMSKLATKMGVGKWIVQDLVKWHRVRSYKEGPYFVCVHRDDAEWLIENYWKVATRDIPINPGAYDGDLPDSPKKAKSIEAYRDNLQRERDYFLHVNGVPMDEHTIAVIREEDASWVS